MFDEFVDKNLFDTNKDYERTIEVVNYIRERIGHSLFDRMVLPNSQTAKDYNNPNVQLIEGWLGEGDGEYLATSVQTMAGSVYLADVIEKFVPWEGKIKSFQWHLSSKPKTFSELEENLVKTAMGICNANFSHAYSDLTGYLWTNESIEVGGHDILKEILTTSKEMDGKTWLVLRIEK